MERIPKSLVQNHQYLKSTSAHYVTEHELCHRGNKYSRNDSKF